MLGIDDVRAYASTFKSKAYICTYGCFDGVRTDCRITVKVQYIWKKCQARECDSFCSLRLT